MGKVRSTYVDHLSTHERSKIHVPCPIVYVRRSREWNTTSELFLAEDQAFSYSDLWVQVLQKRAGCSTEGVLQPAH